MNDDRKPPEGTSPKAEEEIRKSERVLRAAEALGHTGSWEQDLVTGEIFNSEANPRLFFGDDKSKGADLQDYVDAIHPADRDFVMKRRGEMLEGGPPDIEYRVVWPDGSVHIIYGLATVVRDAAGKAIRVYGTNVDITERKQVEEALRQSENNFRALADKSLEGISIFQDQRLVYANAATAELTGYSIEELESMSVEQITSKVLHPLDRDTFAERARRRLAGEDIPGLIELRIIRKDGTTRWIQALNTNIPIEFNHRPAVFQASIDITERKEAEQALRESEAKLKEAQQLAHIGYWERDLIADRITASEETRQIFGTELPFVNQAQLEEMLHPEDRQLQRQVLDEALQGRRIYDVEFRVVRPDGEIRLVHVRDYIVYDESGTPLRMFGAVQDITERKRAEEARRRADELVRAIVEDQSEMIVRWRPDGTRTFVNAAYCRTFGKSYDELVGASIWPLVAERDRQREQGRIASLTPNSPYSTAVHQSLLPDGTNQWQEWTDRAFFDAKGKMVELQSVGRDITERVRAADEIKHQAARAETLARIAARLNRQLELEAVVRAVCQEALDTFGVSHATISLYDPSRDVLAYAGGVNITPELAAKIESIRRAQFEGHARTAGPILVVPDIRTLPNAPSAAFTAELDLRTVVTADLRRDQELIGVLILGVNGQVREFDADELSLLKAVSDQAAIALANALLLTRANEQRAELRALSTRLVQVQESERRMLTTELHDRVGQNLTGLSINLQNMKASLGQAMTTALQGTFEDAQTLLEDTTRQIRDIMAELYTPELEDYGLAAALETYAERVASRANLRLIAELPDLPPPPLPAEIRIALFRSAQDAIMNVVQHSRANQLILSLHQENASIRLTVADNGKGFDPDAASQREAPSWGLKIMRERIESVGGKVKIESGPGQGTRVTFIVARPA